MHIGLRIIGSFLAAALLATEPSLGAEPAKNWTVVNNANNVTISTRGREGTSLLECKGVGFIDAAPIVVKRVIDDTAEYPKFMPYVVETKTISNDGHIRIGYQRLSPPFVGERDYTVRVTCESKPCLVTGGTIYCNRWEVANNKGPAVRKGVTRVNVTEGAWLLEPTTGGKTRATYTIFSDSGGGIPAFLLNKANKTAIPKLFEAVRKQAKLAKYLK